MYCIENNFNEQFKVIKVIQIMREHIFSYFLLEMIVDVCDEHDSRSFVCNPLFNSS